MNNTSKTIKNSLYSVVAQILIFIFQFINRRLFVHFLDVEYLGYSSVFSNVFTLLSVAELGISGIIAVHLYKEIANDNKNEIGKLVYLFKWLYRIVAIIVLVFGLLCSPFLSSIVQDAKSGWGFLLTIYYLQLAGTVAGYLFSYRRIIFFTMQKEYKCVAVDLGFSFFTSISQAIVLALFRNYIVFLIFQILMSIIPNIVIYRMSSIEYPYLNKKYTITKNDIKNRNLVHDIGNFLLHKLCYVTYGGTDSIIISAYCGIRTVALYSNYTVIQSSVMAILFYKLLNPIQATIGNIVNDKREKSTLWRQFQMLDVFNFFFASYISCGFLVFFQPTIQIWMGSELLLPDSFVIIFSADIYLNAVFEIVYKYRGVFGEYRRDRDYMIIAAVTNILLSIIGAKMIGITGVIIGTFVAFLPIAFGRIRFVVGYFFEESVYKYCIKHFGLFLVFSMEGYVIWIMTNRLGISVTDIIIRVLIWITIPTVINVLLYHGNPYYKMMMQSFGNVIKMVVRKVHK